MSAKRDRCLRHENRPTAHRLSREPTKPVIIHTAKISQMAEVMGPEDPAEKFRSEDPSNHPVHKKHCSLQLVAEISFFPHKLLSLSALLTYHIGNTLQAQFTSLP
jgi:hypothetical protein